jgi:spermidine synthase
MKAQAQGAAADVGAGQGVRLMPDLMLYSVFFLSGMAALIYQLIWQRALFTIYGTNTESVTVVVAAFMLGLGVGSLVGGEVSKRLTRIPLVMGFAAIELGIGLFGVVSLPLFGWVGEATLGVSPLVAGAISFGVVLAPTCLMGATLPLLVAHLVKLTHNVGQSVGLLYFSNTIGSAAGCFACAFIVMRKLGMHGSVYFAATLNVVIALLTAGAYIVSKRRQGALRRAQG